MRGPVDLAQQLPCLRAPGPCAPGLGQGDGGGVPVGGPFLRRSGVLLSGGTQLFGFGLDAQHHLPLIGQPPGLGQLSFGG